MSSWFDCLTVMDFVNKILIFKTLGKLQVLSSTFSNKTVLLTELIQESVDIDGQ